MSTASFTIKPLPRVSLVETVVERISSLIEDERLPAGRRLPSELEWAERLGVSRPVVREAIGRLQSVGLVTVSRGRGRGICVGGCDDVVRGVGAFRAALAVSPRDHRQLQEFRTAVEVHAARLAAECITDEDLTDLERLAAAIGGAGGGKERQIQADFAFHRRIVEITKNEIMLNLLTVAQAMIEGGIRENWRRYRRLEIDSRAAHRRIIAALRRRDSEAAQAAMLKHIQPPVERRSSARTGKQLPASSRRAARQPSRRG